MDDETLFFNLNLNYEERIRTQFVPELFDQERIFEI
jgi:hypothetical protein